MKCDVNVWFGLSETPTLFTEACYLKISYIRCNLPPVLQSIELQLPEKVINYLPALLFFAYLHFSFHIKGPKLPMNLVSMHGECNKTHHNNSG